MIEGLQVEEMEIHRLSELQIQRSILIWALMLRYVAVISENERVFFLGGKKGQIC